MFNFAEETKGVKEKEVNLRAATSRRKARKGDLGKRDGWQRKTSTTTSTASSSSKKESLGDSDEGSEDDELLHYEMLWDQPG